MSDSSLGDPGDTTINNDDVPPNSSGLDPGVETAIIVNVVVWLFSGAYFSSSIAGIVAPLGTLKMRIIPRLKPPRRV
jgi:hypothetical protein